LLQLGRPQVQDFFAAAEDLKIKICHGSRGPRRHVTAALIVNNLLWRSMALVKDALRLSSASSTTRRIHVQHGH
jgi:hypothetical protein